MQTDCGWFQHSNAQDVRETNWWVQMLASLWGNANMIGNLAANYPCRHVMSCDVHRIRSLWNRGLDDPFHVHVEKHGFKHGWECHTSHERIGPKLLASQSYLSFVEVNKVSSKNISASRFVMVSVGDKFNPYTGTFDAKWKLKLLQ